MTKEGFSVNIVLTKHRGATMEDKNLINLIKHQDEKIAKLAKDNLDLFTGYTVLIKKIQEQKEEIAQLKGKQND